MKTPKDWIRFETYNGEVWVEVGCIFAVRLNPTFREFEVLSTSGASWMVTKETAEEVVELVAKHRESR